MKILGNAHNFFRRLGLVTGLALAFVQLEPFAGTYTVEGSSTLTSIATAIQNAPTSEKVHRVRFKSYQNVGTFSLPALTADSLIFERMEESAEVVEFSGTLFEMKNVTASVVFRNLAFKAKDGAAIFLEGRAGDKRSLLLDSCQIFGDTLNSAFLSWLGDASSKAEIKRSIVTAKQGGPKAEINLNASIVSIKNCYLNSVGLVTASTALQIELIQNTLNRTQFRLTGNGINSVYVFTGNLFCYPPQQDRLGIGSQKYIIGPMMTYASGSSVLNVRFTTWNGYEYPSSANFPASDNPSVPAFGDTSAMWDFRQVGDTVHGYQNPPGAFPAFNLFPNDTLFSRKFSEKESVAISLAPAQIPRIISLAYGTATYPSVTDSTRNHWLRDTTLVLSGPASVKAIQIQGGVSYGLPLLFVQSGGNFVPGPLGPEGSLNFTNAVPSARVFIPAFAGQNTPKGANVAVKGLSPDTSLNYTVVTRTGRTLISTPALSPENKRLRSIQKGSRPFGLRDTTTAEGSGTLHFGLSKTGADAYWEKDSLVWWLGGSSFAIPRDSAGKWWGSTPHASSFQAVLLERLTIGKGTDTLPLAQGRIITRSALGHQLRIDSLYLPTQAEFPDMGIFQRGLTFRWLGRGSTDSLTLVLSKQHPRQKAYVKEGGKAIEVVASIEDSVSISVPIATVDSNRSIFLARKYPIAAGLKVDLAIGPDSIKGLLSSKPGEMRLDSTFTPKDLDLASSRILAKRKIVLDNLEPQQDFTLVLAGKAPDRPDSVRVRIFDGAAWGKVAFSRTPDNRYAFQVSPLVREVVVDEGLPGPDTIPRPVASPSVSLSDKALRVSLNLTPAEKAGIKDFKVDLFALDLGGTGAQVSSGYLPADSVSTLVLKENVLYGYRVVYRSRGDKSSVDTAWIPLKDWGFNTANVQQRIAQRPSKFFSLIGFPFAATYAGNIATGLSAALSPEKVSLNALSEGRWDSLPVVGNPALAKGKGYLLATALPFQPRIGASPLPGLGPDTVRLEKMGWHLISVPLAFPVPDNGIRLDPAAVSGFRTLLRREGANGKSLYEWPAADTLHPFQGYLVYAFKPTELVFDPFAPRSAPPAKRGTEVPWGTLGLVLSNGQESSSMAFYSGNAFRPTPYFGGLASGLEMRVGGDGGYFLKPVVRLDSIRAKLEVFSEKDAVVNLAMQGSGATLQGMHDIRLLDMRAGRVYTGKDLGAIPVDKGKSTFQLLIGTADEIDREVDQYLARLPSQFSLGQNFPNPFVGETRIRFGIPARLGKVRMARLEAFNLSGKKVASRTVLEPVPGHHELRLGSQGWEPGIYVYTLTLNTGSGPVSLTRRMILGAAER